MLSLSNHRVLLGLLSGILLLLLCYGPSLSGDFLFDDFEIIKNNATIEDYKFSPWNVLTDQLNTRGFTMWTLSVSHGLFGHSSFAYRLGNLFLHAIACSLLFVVIRNSISEEATSKNRLSPSTMAWGCTFLYALHPIQMQAVAYICQRSETLYALFLLLSLTLLIAAHHSVKRVPQVLLLASSIGSCLLGMRSKEIMIVAPLLILLYDQAFLSKSWRNLFRSRGWFHGLIWSTLLFNSSFQLLNLSTPLHRQATSQQLAAVQTENVSNPILTQQGARRSRWEYFQTQPAVIGCYLWQVMIPHHLCFDYGLNMPSTTWLFWPCSIFLSLGFIYCFYIWNKAPTIAFWGLWFFVLLGPRSSFIPMLNPYFEYRMYLPLASVILLIVMGCSRILSHTGWKTGTQKYVLYSLFWVFLTLFSFTTFSRAPVYANNIELWTDTIQKAPENQRAFENLSSAYGTLSSEFLATQNYSAAYKSASRAIELNPNNTKAYVNCAIALRKSGQIQPAFELLMKSLEIEPLPEAYLNLATIASAYQPEKAIEFLKESLELDPEYAEAHNNLATILLMSDQPDRQRALMHLTQAVQLNPLHIDALFNLAQLHYRLGHSTQAIPLLRRVLQQRPNDPGALQLLQQINGQ